MSPAGPPEPAFPKKAYVVVVVINNMDGYSSVHGVAYTHALADRLGAEVMERYSDKGYTFEVKEFDFIAPSEQLSSRTLLPSQAEIDELIDTILESQRAFEVPSSCRVLGENEAPSPPPHPKKKKTVKRGKSKMYRKIGRAGWTSRKQAKAEKKERKS